MDVVKISNLKRDAKFINTILKKKGSTYIALEDLYILVPSRFENKDLMELGSTVTTLGMLAIVSYDKKKYSVLNIMSMVPFTPSSVKDVTIENKLYKELYFEKDTIIVPNTTLLRKDNFAFNEYDELVMNGNVPWYIDYVDLMELASTANKFADSTVGENPIIMEVLAMISARDPFNKKLQYRYGKGITSGVPPVYYGLKNPFFSFDNTLSKTVGSFFGNGINAALVDKEKVPTRLEMALRE